MRDGEKEDQDPTDPFTSEAPNAVTEPRIALLALCVECGEGVEVPLPVDARWLAFLLAQRGWFISVLTPPDQGPEVPMLVAPLCTACAQKVYSPEMYQAAEARRQQLLQAAQAAQANQPR